MKDQRLVLSSVSAEESLVKDFIRRTMDIFESNTLGPQKYLNLYRKYADLLNGKSDQEVTSFLAKRHSIESFIKVRYYFFSSQEVILSLTVQWFAFRAFTALTLLFRRQEEHFGLQKALCHFLRYPWIRYRGGVCIYSQYSIIEYPLILCCGCISMFSVNLTIDKTSMMQVYFWCIIAGFRL